MELITQKPRIKEAVFHCLEAYRLHGIEACVDQLNQTLLENKVKFPLLEYAADLLWKAFPPEERFQFCDLVEALETEGGNVILGKMLQSSLEGEFHASLERAVGYISRGKVWYVSDIIGERVFGFGLLQMPEAMFPAVEQLLPSGHPNVQRGIGAGIHCAVKKGLSFAYADRAFQLLLTVAKVKDTEAKSGIGWAAKTIAKFHPSIIGLHQNEIQNEKKVGKWFQAKVNIGLVRNTYAKGN